MRLRRLWSSWPGNHSPKLIIAIINESYTGIAAGQDHGWLIDELNLITHYIGGVISFVNLRAYESLEIEQRVTFADVVYIVGGAQLVLPRLFRETGFDILLPRLAKTKVVMGTSAGANVLGKQITNAKYWQDQYGSSAEYLAYRSLELVEFNILPHFTRPDHPNRTTERLQPIISDNPFPLYGITDTQAVTYNNGQIEFIGGKPVKFSPKTL